MPSPGGQEKKPKPRGRPPASSEVKAQRLDDVSHFNQVYQQKKDEEIEQQMALYPSNKPYISSRNEGQLPRKRGRASFVDRIRLMHEQQLERSTVIN